MTWKKKFFVFTLFLSIYFLPFLSSHASHSENVIRAVEVKGLTRIDEEELIDLICFHPGDVLDRNVLAAGIKRAFGKGIFYDIQAMTHPYDGGITLVYLVKEIPVVNKIIIEGNHHFFGRMIKKNILLKKGEDFNEELLRSSKSMLLKFYKRRGYHDARIELLVKNTEKPAEVNIRIRIVEGEPLIINRIIVSRDVRHLLTVEEGDIYDRDKVDESIKRLKDYFRKRNYINPLIGPISFTKGELTIPILEGAKLEVIFEGNDAVSTGKLGKEVLFMESGEVTNDLVSETADRIMRLYESKGYYGTGVDAAFEKEDELIRVTFVVAEGRKVVLRKVSFSGISVDPEKVKQVVTLKENKPFDSSLLISSEDALVSFYNALGYLQMKVGEIRKEFQDDGRDINIEFVIAEGPQTKIKSIEIVGNEKISRSEIHDALRLYGGLPYNAVNVSDERQRVLSLYARQGYLDASVIIESTVREDKASLAIKIKENKQSVIGKIIVRGNDRTRLKIIKREITFREGEPINREEMTSLKRRLYRLGIFSEVSIDILDPDKEGNNEVARDILITLKESKAGTVEVAVGYGDYERLRGGIDIRYRNFGGYDREIGFRAEISSVEERVVFNFREPWFLNKRDVPLNLYLLRENTESVNADTRDVLYKISRLSFVAGVKKWLAENLKAGLGYEYSEVDTSDVKPGVVLSREDVGVIGISAISPSLFYDTRDYQLNATTGSFQRIVLKWASKLFFSETEFIKATFKSSWFFPFKKWGVFAISFSGGAGYNFGESESLPLVERYFLGGATTARGYIQDFLGPKGEDGSPTGGNLFALTNWEMRLPLPKGFGLVPFVDAGNVWQTFDDVEAELKFTVGAGLRYDTPIGPIRVDYGHKLDKEPGESSGELHFSIGQAF